MSSAVTAVERLPSDVTRETLFAHTQYVDCKKTGIAIQLQISQNLIVSLDFELMGVVESRRLVESGRVTNSFRRLVESNWAPGPSARKDRSDPSVRMEMDPALLASKHGGNGFLW